MNAVEVARFGAVAEIAVDNPPVNAIDRATRRSLLAALKEIEGDPSIRSVVLAARGTTWPVAADLRDFGTSREKPSLADLCRSVAGFPKPVVAALHGAVLGGGLELALCAQFRVAAAGTRFGFPDVALGLCPGAGGTQRLPRLVGAKCALELLLSGAPIGCDRALSEGLIDAVAEDAINETARALAENIAASGGNGFGSRDRDRGLRDASTYLAAITAARGRARSPHLPAARRIIDCVEAALLLPTEAGLTFESAAYDELAASPQAAALRHAFFAERRAGLVPETSHAKPRPLSQIGVIGGGARGAAIAAGLLTAGLRVTLVERDVAALDHALTRVANLQESAVTERRLAPEAREAAWGRLTGATVISALAPCDMVIEAIAEDEDAKRDLFAQIDAVAAAGAVLVTTSRHIGVNRIATATKRPADVLGLHFPAPPGSGRLIEVVLGAATAADAVATGFDLARRTGQVAVRSGAGAGTIGTRLQDALWQATDFLMEDGASPYQIDRALRGYGFAIGRYQAEDRAGLDIDWERRRRLAATRDPKRRYVAIGDRLCEMGRLGRIVGRGYYRYSEAGEATEDPEVLEITAGDRRGKGLSPREVGADEVIRRCLGAMANEGARLLEEGMALRPSDIDTVAMLGLGFPRHRGGPMQAADQEGLLLLRDALRAYAASEAWFWRPAPIWDGLIKNGRRFADLNDV